MEYFFYLCLFIFWTLFWSFWSVLIYRLKSWESWILNWRSHCAKCNTSLKALDLIPIFSWLINKAKCKYCKDKISSIYPILEISTWILFILIWYFLIDFNLIVSFNIYEIIKLLFWLTIWFISILYTFYDILFLEIHEWMMLTWISLAIIWIIFQTIIWYDIISSLPLYHIPYFYSSIVLLIISIWALYIIMLNEFSEWIDTLILIWTWILIYAFNYFTWVSLIDSPILSPLLWVMIIFVFFFLQIVLSKWRALGWWDLRIAILIWLLLWYSFSIAWLMLTYLVWSIIWISILIYSKFKNKWKTVNTQVPFWPFLAIWFFLTIFLQNQIETFISIYF